MGADATGSQPQFLAIFFKQTQKEPRVCTLGLLALGTNVCLELGWLDRVLAAQWPSELALSLAAKCDCLKQALAPGCLRRLAGAGCGRAGWGAGRVGTAPGGRAASSSRARRIV